VPTNLPPHYYKAEDRFKAAKDPHEKIAHLKEMMAIMPHHKGTDKIRAELNKKLSALNAQLEQAKKSGKAKGINLYYVPPQEAPQAMLVGAANAGKSSLVAAVTNAAVEVAEYPFTTTLPKPGMMAFEDVQIELVDTPPVMQRPLEYWLVDQARATGAILVVADLGAPDCCEMVELIKEGFGERGIELVDQLDEDEERAQNQRRTLLVANKADHPDAPVNLEFLQELLPLWPRVLVSSRKPESLELFRRAVFDRMEIVRVYTKIPGKPAEMDTPYIVPVGATVLEVAGKVHRDFLETFVSAKVWGSGKFDGQTVDREHRVADGDLIEIHTR